MILLSLYTNIKNRRLELGMTQDQLAEKAGYTSRTSISKIEAGYVDLIQSKIISIANALQTTPARLMGWTDNSIPEISNIIPVSAMNPVPLVGSIACGTPILAEPNVDEVVFVPEDIHCDFCLRCKGDSMTGDRIHDGDIVYIRQQPRVENGQIAAVSICDETTEETEATLKHIHLSDDSIILTSSNPNYQPFVYSGDDMNKVRILGRAVGFTSPL